MSLLHRAAAAALIAALQFADAGAALGVTFLAQGQQQQPFFRDRRPQQNQAEPPAPPTPRLELRTNPAKPGSFEAKNPANGAQYNVRPDPYSPGWYQLQDKAGQTIYTIRPDPRAPGKYETGR